MNFRNGVRFISAGALFTALGVSLAGQTPVNVANPGDIAKALGVQTPFAANIICVNAGPNNVCEKTTKVPSGVRWIIKNLSVSCNVPAEASVLSASLETTVQGTLTAVVPYVPPTKFLTPNPTVWGTTLAQTTEIYADSGTNVRFFATLSVTAPAMRFLCTVGLQGQAIGSAPLKVIPSGTTSGTVSPKP